MNKQVNGEWQLKKVDLGSSIRYHVSNDTESADTFEGCCDLLNARDEQIEKLEQSNAIFDQKLSDMQYAYDELKNRLRDIIKQDIINSYRIPFLGK